MLEASSSPSLIGGFILRSYCEADLEACYALDQVCFSPDIAYTRSELRYFLTRRNAYTIVADQPGNLGLAGFLIANEDKPDRAGVQTAHIVTLDVAPEMRRCGVAAKLMAALEQHYRELHFQRLALEVAANNHAALSFYGKHGFVPGKRLAGYYNGTLDAIAMKKILEPG